MASKISGYDQFLLFGDSITELGSCQCFAKDGFGFVSALQEVYIRRLDIVNRGLSGYNTDNALAALSKIVTSPDHARIRLMTIFFGANDACLPNTPSKQHVPIDKYRSNLREILQSPALKAHNPRIILITPGPVNEYGEERTDYLVENMRTAANIKAYADAVCEVGETEGVAVLNLWKIMATKAGWKQGDEPAGTKTLPENHVLKELLSDGLHFTPDSYRIVHESLMKLIESTWPDQMPDRLPSVLPDWKSDLTQLNKF